MEPNGQGNRNERGIHVYFLKGYFHDGDFAEAQEEIQRILDLDYVTGINVYAQWRLFEPEEGQFKWEYFDFLLDACRARNKMASIGLAVCARSPQWLMERVGTFTYTHGVVGLTTAPIPWDPGYEQALSRTIRAMAARYDGHPHLQYVTINGPASLFGVEINWPMVPNTIPDEDKQRLDFTLDKFKIHWMRMIDLFTDEFKRSPLSLGLHCDIGMSEYTAEEKLAVSKDIRDYAIERYRIKRGEHDKLIVRLLGLNQSHPHYFMREYSGEDSINKYISLVWDVRDRARIGYEVTRIWSKPPTLTPDEFMQIMKNGISYLGEWIEVKEPDIWDRSANAPFALYAEALQYAHRELVG